MEEAVFVGTPTTRDFDALHVSSLLGCDKPKGGFFWYPVIGQAIAEARNQIVDVFLRYPSQFNFLLMADSDATWHPDSVTRLMSRNLPVVSGMIFRRGLPPVPTLGKYIGRDEDDNSVYSFGPTIERIIGVAEKYKMSLDIPNTMTLEDDGMNDLFEIDGCGMHFCMIRRDVLEKMERPWFHAPTRNSGEDFYFCRGVKKAGFQLFGDTSVMTGHIVGPGIDIGLREFLAFYKHSEEMKKSEEIWKVVGLK